MRRVLVTGGAGFIGAHLVRALLARGDATRVLDNFVTGTAANLALALGLDRAAVERALADRDGGVVRLTDRCEGGAGGVRRVVSASSSAVYGDTELPKHEGQVPQPKSPYAASKLAGEAYCAVYSRGFDLPTVALRYFNVFGPWQDPASEYAAVIPKFILLALRGEPLPVHGDGMQSRDFTYVDNVVEATLLAAESEAAGVALNVGAGVRYTLLDLIDRLQRILGRRLEIVYKPPPQDPLE